MRDLHGLSRKQDTTSSHFLSALSRTAPSVNETTTQNMEQIFSNTMRLHEQYLRDRTEKGKARNGRRQQHLVWSFKRI